MVIITADLLFKGFNEGNIKKLKYCPDIPLHLTCDFNVDPMMWCIAHKDGESDIFLMKLLLRMQQQKCA